jgi:TRAP-type mannitol/chloroaromatic compound transport system permease small subunit
MSAMYMVLLPLVALVLKKRTAFLTASINSGDSSRIKAEQFFFGLVILIIMGLMLLTESTKS